MPNESIRPASSGALLPVVLALSTACAAPDTGRDAAREDTAAAVPADSVAARDTSPANVGAVVTVYFSRGDSVVPVTRTVDDADLASAIRALLRGPTAAERAAGLSSWFSDSTADMLRSVGIDTAGTAVIDFADLRPVIPNASASAGSAMLLRELNATVFAHDEVSAVQYRIEGSCDAFWEWLQYGCQTVQRPAR